MIDAWRRTDGKTGFIGILEIPDGVSQFTLIFELAESDENVQIDIWNADFFVEYGQYKGKILSGAIEFNIIRKFRIRYTFNQ